RLTLALAAAALVVGIEATALVAARLFQRELGTLVLLGLFDLEIGNLEFLQHVGGAERSEFARGHCPVPHRHAALVVLHASRRAIVGPRQAHRIALAGRQLFGFFLLDF